MRIKMQINQNRLYDLAFSRVKIRDGPTLPTPLDLPMFINQLACMLNKLCSAKRKYMYIIYK